MKLPALVEAFLQYDQVDRRLAAGTLRVYRLWLARFVEFWRERRFGARRLQPETVSSFLQWLDRRAKRARGRALEPATQDKAYDAVSAFVSWGRTFGHVKTDPFRQLKPPVVPDRPRVVWPRERILELLDFIEHFADGPQPRRRLAGRFHPRHGGRRLQPNPRGWRERVLCQRDAALLATEYFTGGRISAICPLRPENLNFDSDDVTMPKVKGGGWHVVPMSPELRRRLRRWMRVRETLWRKWKVCSSFVFPTLPGRGCSWLDSRGHVDASRIERVLRERYLPAFRERHPSVPPDHFTPHCLRHSFATRLLELNVRPRAVQEILDHASLDTTMIYTRLRPRHLREAVARG